MARHSLGFFGRAVLAFAGAFIFVPNASAATYNVTTVIDGNPGCLRLAVASANANPGADTIVFDPVIFEGPPTVGVTMGEILITGPLTIDGPPQRVVISGNGSNRVFRIDDSTASNIMVIFRNLRFYFGRVFGVERGGAILVANENLSCTDCEFYGNTSQDAGGAINFSGGIPSFLTLTRCTFRLNEALTAGGAFSAYGIVITSINNCMFTENRAAAGGVINQNAGGQIAIHGSTFWANTATGSGAGAIFLNGNFGQSFIRNSTFTGNQAWSDGGAINLGGSYSPSITVQNCTIVDNVAGVSGGGGAGGSGGGIANALGAGSGVAINLNSCIFWGNTSANPGPALYTPGTVNSAACLIQSSAGVTTFAGDAFTNTNLGVNPKISSLTNNGGPTLTHLLQYGSPAIDNGQNPASLTTDQRGTGFTRIIDGDCDRVLEVDIGALEAQICACRGDANENAIVDIDDLVLVITNWGYLVAPGGILADVNNDGTVNIDDLVVVITGWGGCK